MKRMIRCALAFGLMAAMGGCAGEDVPDPQQAPAVPQEAPPVAQVQQAQGTGLILDSLTGLTVPLLGLPIGNVAIVQQVLLTNLILVEDVVGNIVGLEAEGVLRLTGGVLGTRVIEENFRTEARIASSGPGQCQVLTIDLGPISVDILSGVVASVDLPEATVDVRGSGLLGVLLCALGQLLQPPIQDVIVPILEALVRAIDALLL
jgi:hypothetical protein